MKEADLILKWTEELREEIKNLPYSEDDIRIDFFGTTYDVVYNYYKGYLLIELANLINSKQIVFKEDLKYSVHIDRITETVKHHILRDGYLNSLNRGMLISAWSIFELCVSTFCGGLCNEQELNNLLEYQYNEIIKKTKNDKLSDAQDLIIKKLTLKEHLTHVPIIRKTDFLFKKCKDYKRNKENDKEYLRFLGKLRNTMHTNFIFYGKDCNYRFGDVYFEFKNNKMVKWSDNFNSTAEFFLFIVGELKEIWKELIKAIPFPGLIPYPDNDQE